MTARRRLVLAAVIVLLAAAAAGTTAILVAALGLTLAAVAVAAPTQPGTYRRRSTIAVPGAATLPTRAGDGPHPEGATS